MPLIPMPATREEWLAMRTRYIGASEVAALFGQQPDSRAGAYALWHVKAGLTPEPDIANTRTKWGLLMEEVIATAAAEERNWTVARGRYAICDACPGLAASLDFEILEGDPRGPGVLEVKNVGWLQHRKSWTDNEPPIHILLQLQAQLLCTGYSWGAVAALADGNDLHIYPYTLRPGLASKMKARVAAFWQSVRDNRPPAVDGSDSASAVLRALYPETTDAPIDMSADNELPDLCARLLAAGEARRAAQKAEAEAGNAIRAKIGPHRRARAQGFWVNVAVTPAKPDRLAEPGEIIKGRAETRRLTIKEMAA